MRVKSLVALALTFVAGWVDITGALAIYDVFTAHMTGATVRLGQHLMQRDWHDALITGVVLGTFVSGSVTGRVVIEIGSRYGIRSIASATLALEAAALAAVALIGTNLYPVHQSFGLDCVLLGMLATAMGLQTATLTRVGPLTVHTTFVTGMLNKLAQLASHWLFRSYDLLRDESDKKDQLRGQRQIISRQVGFLFSIWLLCLGGAAAGAAVAQSWKLKSLLLPCCLLLGAIAVDQFQPLSVEEESDQWEK